MSNTGVDDDNDEPYALQIALATAVADSDKATDSQQRSSRAKIRRLRNRPVQRGVSVFDFASIPGTTLRLYMSADKWRADPQGDAELATILLNPFTVDPNTVIPKLSALINRPHYLLKVNEEPEAFRPPGTVSFHMMRSREFAEARGRDESEPFQDGDSQLILFDDLTRRPVFYVTVVGVDRARNYDAASGAVALQVTPFNQWIAGWVVVLAVVKDK